MTGNDFKLKRQSIKFLLEFNPDAVRSTQYELACIGMINSIIAYKYPDLQTSPEELINEVKKEETNYLEPFIDFFGEEKLKEMIQEQLDDIAFIDVSEEETDEYGDKVRAIVWRDQIN